LTNANCFESINKMSQCCVEYQQTAVLFDIFQAVTKSIILVARNSVTTLTLKRMNEFLLIVIVAKFAICFLPLFCYCRAAAAAKLLLLPDCFAAVGKNPPYA
jgi:hypothetical protein